MGNMTVEEIYRERKTFSNAVFEVSKKDFVKFGMSIISYTLKDITDEVGYLKVSTEICFLSVCYARILTSQPDDSALFSQYKIFQALGQSRTAQVQKDARIGEAEARRDAGMAEAEAEMQRMEAKLANDTEIARAKRDFDLKKATYDVEVNTARAEAEKAYELQVQHFLSIS